MSKWGKLTGGRALTAGEYRVLQPIFRHALDYGRVRVMARRYLPFQAAWVAMSPNGRMFFPSKSLYCTDFSNQPPERIDLLIHETVHVWQHQMGFPVRWCGLCLALQGGYVNARAYAYRHLLGQRLDLAQYNMEQQAVIITAFFSALRAGREIDERLAALMQGFLTNPANRDLLPSKCGWK